MAGRNPKRAKLAHPQESTEGKSAAPVPHKPSKQAPSSANGNGASSNAAVEGNAQNAPSLSTALASQNAKGKAPQGAVKIRYFSEDADLAKTQQYWRAYCGAVPNNAPSYM